MSEKTPAIHRLRLEAPLSRPRATVRRRSTERWQRHRDARAGGSSERPSLDAAAPPLA